MSESTSEILLNQARSTTSPGVATVLIALVLVVLVVRLAVVRTGRPQLMLTALLTVMAVVVLLRDPRVQDVLSAAGINLASVRVLGHSVIMFGAVATWFLARAWRSSYVFRRPEVAVALAGAAMLSGWLWWVSRPARELNVAVEDFESWVTAGYLVPVSLPVPVACAAIIVALVMHGVERRSWRTWLWVSAGLVAAGFQLVDHLSRAISGFLLSLGRHSWLTDLRTQGVDQLFLPAVAALALCTIPGIVSELRSVGHRRDARAAATDLELLWREITAAVPGVSKPETGTLPIEERVAEMLIEIEDGLIRLNLSLASTSAEEAARDLIALLAAPALESSTVPSSVRVPDWVADQSKIRLVAREYRAMTSASHVSI